MLNNVEADRWLGQVRTVYFFLSFGTFFRVYQSWLHLCDFDKNIR